MNPRLFIPANLVIALSLLQGCVLPPVSEEVASLQIERMSPGTYWIEVEGDSVTSRPLENVRELNNLDASDAELLGQTGWYTLNEDGNWLLRDDLGNLELDELLQVQNPLR